ncbi:hypothetical protein IFM46972_07654 [Aspergillus udagawae]|uniref:Uncharacterized protein n=1 Tax=Aspergillus udagawae TaxID=91492 RepID=A0A8H3P5Q8_9EURO|nr:hypothetical protein IFM46972_07654 [Aspergillus udagawae]
MDALSMIFANHEAIMQQGFLTPEPPLEPLSHHYLQWETIVANLLVLLMSHRLWESINSIPGLCRFDLSALRLYMVWTYSRTCTSLESYAFETFCSLFYRSAHFIFQT